MTEKTTVNHLEMADDALRYSRVGEGIEVSVMAIGYALVALVKRADQGLQALEDIAESLEKWRWDMLTPDQRSAELKFEADQRQKHTALDGAGTETEQNPDLPF